MKLPPKLAKSVSIRATGNLPHSYSSPTVASRSESTEGCICPWAQAGHSNLLTNFPTNINVTSPMFRHVLMMQLVSMTGKNTPGKPDRMP